MCYFLVLAFEIHNLVRYVIMQERYVFHIWYFYAVSILSTILRIIFFTLTFVFLLNPETLSLNALPNYINYIGNYATYLYLILGVQ